MKLTLNHFTKTVTTAGTREQLRSSGLKVPSAVIQALRGNSNPIFVGNSAVSATNHFISLTAGTTITLSGAQFGLAEAQFDLSKVWLDVTTNTEGVMVGYVEREEGD